MVLGDATYGACCIDDFSSEAMEVGSGGGGRGGLLGCEMYAESQRGVVRLVNFVNLSLRD